LCKSFKEFLHLQWRVSHLLDRLTSIIVRFINFEFFSEFFFSLLLGFDLLLFEFIVVLFLFGFSLGIGVKLFIELNFLKIVNKVPGRETACYTLGKLGCK